MEITNKVAIVTGASAGIGTATVTELAGAGAKLVLAARSAETLKRLAASLTAKGHEAIAVPTDMRDPSQITTMVREAKSRFGRVDILVNNAGQAAAGLVAEVALTDVRQIIELNVFGPLLAMQAVIPLMKEEGGGVIVNVSSMVSKMHIPGLGAYAATKAALNLLSETARYELEASGIKVITMFPRTTATDFGKNSIGNQALRQRQRGNASTSVPVDPPEAVARRIVEAIRQELPEQYMDR
ncbi:MAG TPA: SDR family oxidoreductase [Spirochaetia bacterium]|nr:SDR family oxidoreductase [Spirochaetia bacterium]